MAALCNGGHYIFALWLLSIFYLLSTFLFFPRLISWMSTCGKYLFSNIHQNLLALMHLRTYRLFCGGRRMRAS